MYKRFGKRWISIAFIIIFCLTGISADFHQSYAFLSCASESESGRDAVGEREPAAHAASYRAQHHSLPDYVLLSEKRAGRVHYRYEDRESGRINPIRVKTLHFDLPRGLCGCHLFIAASRCVLDCRTSSEEAALTYIHNKDGKKA